MKILTLLGSARKKGNTATVLTMVEDELQNMGHEIERIALHNQDISGCLGCGKCKEKPHEIACIQKDDATAIMEKMTAADGIIFTTPIYFWGFSAQTKALMDRSYAFVTDYHKPGHTSLLKGKRIALLSTGADSYENNAEGAFTSFDRFADFLLAGSHDSLYITAGASVEELRDNSVAQATEFARSIVA